MKFWYGLYRWSEKADYKVIIFLGLSAFLIGFLVYKFIYGLPILESIIYASELFAMEVKTPFELKEFLVDLHGDNALSDGDGIINKMLDCHEYWWVIYVAAFLATLTLVTSIALLLFRDKIEIRYRKSLIKNGEHTIVIGLGRNSQFFIKSLLEDKNKDEKHKIIVFERDKSNPLLSKYKKKELSIISKNIDHMMDELNLENVKQIFISTGDDEQNIYFALQFIALFDAMEESRLAKLLVHVENRTLRNLYSDKGVITSKKVDIKLFSYYKEAARILFEHHPVDGDDCDIITNEKEEEIHLVVVGNSELSISVVSEACRLSHFPNGNKLIIYCIDKDAYALKSKVLYAFPQIEKIASVEIRYIGLDSQAIEFYEHSLWHKKNLKNIVFCHENAVENITVATKLKSVTFLREEKLESKFHIATMHHINIAKKMQKYSDEHIHENRGNYLPFAQANVICTQKNLLESRIDYMAKMIHYTYGSHYFREEYDNIAERVMENEWKKASVADKRASVGQAIHLDTKLKCFNLKRVKYVGKTTQEDNKRLLEENEKVFYDVVASDLEALGLSKEYLKYLEKIYKERHEKPVPLGLYFPFEYENLFEQMLGMEHKRWMSILMLMDNIHDEKAKKMNSDKRKQLRMHHLLKSFDAFEESDERIYIINDINALLNIPEYMMLSGYKLEKR